MFIDADTHVDECDDTWEYLPADLRYLAPRTLSFERDQVPPWLGPIGSVRTRNGTGYDSGYYRYWFIDGQVYVRRVRSDQRTGTSLATRELVDVAQRVRDMDEMGVDVQVIYPTLFLHEVTRRPELEAALCRSYNRWVADRCVDGHGRLRWVAMIPYGSMPDAISELNFAKEHGAVGAFKRGVESGERGASDPYFFPAYRVAAELDLPICIHQASSWKPMQLGLTMVRLPEEFPILAAFSALIHDRVPDEIPDLRFGFIEAGSGWVPYLLDTTGANDRKETLEALRFFVTCEVKEDLNYLTETVGDENFIVGTDYCHADRAAVRDAHRQVTARSDLSESTTQRITSDNARRLYSL